jgi:signal transduction histidine kinase
MSAISENLRGPQVALVLGSKPGVRWTVARDVLSFCLFETAFYFAYRYGMSFSQAFASPFWFPDTVLLCALLFNRPGRWWLFVLGPLPIRLLVSVPMATPLWFLLATFAIDSIKGLLAATLLRRSIGNSIRLETVREFMLYSLYAVLLVPALDALAGAAARYFLGDRDYWKSYEQWFMGNAMAHVVVTPAVLYWVFGATRDFQLPSWKRCLEGGLLAAGLVLTGYLALNADPMEKGFAEVRFYAPVPFLFWAAIRFGVRGASGAIIVIAFLAVQAAFRGHGVFAGQSPADTAQSLQRFLLLRAAPLYLVAVLIEQMKRAEAAVQKQRMEMAHVARVSTMGQLASAIAHELNQPLGAILRNAEAAEMIMQQGSPDLKEVRAILADIRQDDQRAAAVIDRMRSLLKRRSLEFESIPLKQLLDQVTQLVRSELTTRGVTLRVTVPPGLPLVQGDRVHLQQVLINLLINGADAMSGFPPELRQLEVRVGLSDGEMVEIQVSDTGPGLSAEKLSHLFEPFFTTKSSGMGMGLVISRTIVEAHGGHIWAENNAEGGATFHFTLQAAEPGDSA